MNFDTSSAKAFDSSTYEAVHSLTQVINVANVADPYLSPMPQALQRTELGYNSYMEWGYWIQPGSMTDGDCYYAFNNKGYYVWGDKTASLPSSFSGTFSGPAWGTVW